MSLKLILRPEAKLELAEAKMWYDKQRKRSKRLALSLSL
jgi:hypothetical protein